MHRPNFFIIGAPKCGTTALSEYLRQHPNVYFSEPKEPDFFSADIGNRYKVRDQATYEALFSGVRESHIAIGEGSVGYLQSRMAVKTILGYSANAKFVVMLRNPSDLAYSWHSEAQYNCGESAQDFETAWRLQDERSAGRHIPTHCPDVQLLMYREVAAIGSHLERVLEVVAADRLHVILFDDFRTDTKGVYEEVLKFLGLASDGRRDFPVINESKQVRSPLLMELSHTVARIKKKLGITGGTGILETLNVKRRPREPLTTAFRDELTQHFCPEVKKVEKILGRDLSAWRTLSNGQVIGT